MDIEQLVRENIAPLFHLSLATSANNKPWVCEVHFAYDDNLNLYFRSKPSRRHSQEIANNPNVAGNIVKQFTLVEAPVGIYFEGTAKHLDPGPEQNTAFECIVKRLGVGPEILQDAQNPDGHHFYKITVENYYAFGKFGSEATQKHQLPWNGGQK